MFRNIKKLWVIRGRFPRARGDVPLRATKVRCPLAFSPRTRGCSQAGYTSNRLYKVFPAHAGMFRTAQQLTGVFPAHAGMFRLNPACGGGADCFPRARGDVPPCQKCRVKLVLFSPRTRGCSGAAAGGAVAGTVFPAHAGMFRALEIFLTPAHGFPRARGDVPDCAKWA